MRLTPHEGSDSLQENLASGHSKELQVDELQQAFVDVAAAFGGAIAARDAYTAGHQNNVARIAVAIGVSLGISEFDLMGIRLGALLHDIGKIGVPLEYLTKTHRLTDPEMSIVKLHPEIGYRILKDVQMPWPVKEIVHQHHERLDGSGYPRGLAGDDIVPEAQIVAVADCVDAILNPRPYRGRLEIADVKGVLLQERGRHLDVEAVEACLSIIGDGKQWIRHVGV